MSTRCRPGDLALVIRSESGNEGREVSVVRLLSLGEVVPLDNGISVEIKRDGQLWLVKARYPLRNDSMQRLGFGASCDGIFGDDCLMPIRPEEDQDEDVIFIAPYVTVMA